MAVFGRLETVQIREGWPREDQDFTPWLATEGLALLGSEIGMELERVETESVVGSYRADILAKEAGTGEFVVIENQFGRTDHTHLGQLLTYAAGVGADGSGAKTIVWVAGQFTEPHRATLDWLNRCTEAGIRFFAVEIQLWRIGTSPFAPKFEIVSRPNNEQKQLTQQISGFSKADLFYQEFWTEFMEFCEGNSTLVMGTPPPQSWLPTALAGGGLGVNLAVSRRDRRLECQLWIEGRHRQWWYEVLLGRKEEILASLGGNTRFDEMPGRKSSKIFELRSADVGNREEWPAIHKWLKDRGEAYVAFFKPLIEQIRARQPMLSL